MPQALISINTVAGSNTDLPINTLVQLNNVGIGGETTYNWTIVDQPAGTTDSLSSSTIVNPTFTPKKEGTYLLKLVVNQGTGTEQTNTVVAAIRQLKTRTRIPAAQEKTEADPNEGWSASLATLFQLVDSMRASPGTLVGVAGSSGLTPGMVLRISAESTIKSGLPGQETLPTLVQALADTPAHCLGDLFILVSGVDGSTTPASGALLLTRRLGLYAGVSGLNQAVGTEVFLSDAGAITSTPGTVRRRVGVVVSQSANSDIHFDAHQMDGLSSGAVAFQLGKAGGVQLKPASWSSFGTGSQTVLDAMATGSIALGYQGAILSGYTNGGTGAAVSFAVIDPQAVTGAHVNFGYPSSAAVFNGAGGITLQHAFTTVASLTTTAVQFAAPIQLKDATAYNTVVSFSSGYYVFGPGGSTDSAMLTGKNVELLASSGNSITLNFGTLQPFTFQSAQCTVGSGDNTATPSGYTFQGASASAGSGGSGGSITWAAGLKDGAGTAGAHIWKTSGAEAMRLQNGLSVGLTNDPGAGFVGVPSTGGAKMLVSGTYQNVITWNSTRFEFGQNGTDVLFWGGSNTALYTSGGNVVAQAAAFQVYSSVATVGTCVQLSNTLGQFGLGDSTATPGAYTIRGANNVAGTTNTAGAALTLQAGLGTGNAAPAALIVNTSTPGSSGTALQSAQEVARFQKGLSIGTTTDAGLGGLRVAASFQLVSTDNSGTPGNNTANTPSGRCKVSATAGNVVVTNNLVTAASHVYAWISQSSADSTFTSVVRVAPAAGSFTIFGNANATGSVQVDWVVVNP